MLPTEINRTKTYYKITNAEECHFSLQYKTGLNIDPVPFNNNPKASCCGGGIYFTTVELIHEYFWAGCWIREITVPNDAKVVLDFDEKNKYRADKVILGKRYSFEWYFNNIFDKKTFPKNHYCSLAENCSNYFNKWFDKKTYPTKDYCYLAENCSNYFNKWFDKKTYPIEDYHYLAENCSDYFNKWFDKKNFPQKYYYCLAGYCQKYKHIWNK